MAQSRLEKVGTIYSRITALIKTKAIPIESKPLWVDLYEAFPPKYEPTFGRPVNASPIRNIFYKEDLIRAKFHKQHRVYSMVNLLNNSSESKTETFIHIYRQLEKDGIPEDEIYDKAIEEFQEKFKDEIALKEAERLNAASQFAQKPRKTLSIKKLVAKKESEYAKLLSKEASEQKLTEEENKAFKPIRLNLEKLFESENPEERQKPK